MKCTSKRIFPLFFLSDRSCDRPKDAQSSRNNGISVKNSVKSVCFNNDRAITQNTPKCVENCSDDQLSYICSSTCYQLKYEALRPKLPQYCYSFYAYKHFLLKKILNCLIFIIITLFCEKLLMENDYLVNIYKIYYTNQN